MTKFDGAITDLNQAVSLDPRNAENFSVRGEAKRLKGDFRHALEDANTAVRNGAWRRGVLSQSMPSSISA